MTAEELLATMTEPLVEEDEYCTIDPETRVITIPPQYQLLGVESDEKAERIYFKCPKIVGDDIDLSKLALRVNFRNAGRVVDQYRVDDVAVDGDNITFSWLLSRRVTQYEGDVDFIVCAVRVHDDATITNEWNTTIATATVLEGLETDYLPEEEEQARDLLTELILEATKQIEQKGQETLATIPEDYTQLQEDVGSLSEENVYIIKSLEEAYTKGVDSKVDLYDTPLVYEYITVIYLKKEKFLTGIDINCRTSEPTTVKVTVYIKNGDTETVLSEANFETNGSKEQTFSIDIKRGIAANLDIYVKVEPVNSKTNLYYPSTLSIENELIGYKNGSYNGGIFVNSNIRFSGVLYFVDLSHFMPLIDETKSELKNLSDSKLDKKCSTNLLNPDTFRYGYFYFFNGQFSYNENMMYGCTEPILVNGQNIIGDKVGTRDQGLASYVVFDEQGKQLRIVDGNQYTYQEGDYSVVASYVIFNNMEYAKTTALVYGEEYAFEEYTEYFPEYENKKRIEGVSQRVTALEKKVDPTKEPISIITPAPVYSVCNDIDESRGVINTLWIDHLIKNNSIFNKLIGFTDFCNDHICLGIPLKTEMESEKIEKELSLDIKSDFFDCSPYSDMTIKHRIAKSSGSSDSFPKVLVIGDSVTDGYLADVGKINNDYPNKYWAWCDYFFRLDKMLNYSNDDDKCNYLSVGASSSSGNNYGSADSYKINEQTEKCFAVGKGGWSAEDLFLPTFESEKNVNPFYDPGAGGFSLKYFVDNFKTLENDGKTRLTVGSTAGSKVTDVNSWDVCEPTHVVINLNHNSTFEEYKTNIPKIIEKIKQEYPNMIIILMSIDETGTYFPQKYPDSYINTLRYLHDKNIQIYEYIRDNLVNEENKIYLCSGNLVQPTVRSYPSLDYVKAEMYGSNYVYNAKSNGGGPEWHPNNHAHSAWGYQLYSLIKWTMTN